MMEVLQNKSQIAAARRAMIQKDVSLVDSRLKTLLKRLRLASGIVMGDVVKSWDVLRTLEFIESRLDKGDPIADIGCYASEVLVALCKVGYTNLTGVDLNPKLSDMPYQGRIRYEVSDFKHTPFSDASFKAITSISVIEHGFEAEPLLKEISRLLMPGGHFIASFDYWPEKIDTSTTKFFDMDWIIFSKQDVDALLGVAARFGLHPVGPLNCTAGDRVIDCAGKQYTFGMLVLRKGD